MQEDVGQSFLVGPLRIAENAVERFGVGLLDAAHGGLQRLAHIGRDGAYVVPMATFRYLKAVVLGK